MEGSSEKIIGHIEGLMPFLSDEEQKQLAKILAYGEEMKAEGKRKKKEFWSTHNRDDFKKLLVYNQEHRDEIEGKCEYLCKMNELERNKFIEEYLYDDMLYSYEGDIENLKIDENVLSCGYSTWKNGKHVSGQLINFNFSFNHFGAEGARYVAENLKLEDGMDLNLDYNDIGLDGIEVIAKKLKLEKGVMLSLNANKIGSEGAKAITKNMKLKEGMILNLSDNKIRDEGVKAISHMKLEEGVSLDLSYNQIGDEGVKAIAENMELKEGVTLNLSGNDIGDEGAKAIMRKMVLRKGVTIDLKKNNISLEMKGLLLSHAKSYKDAGINCKIDLGNIFEE